MPRPFHTPTTCHCTRALGAASVEASTKLFLSHSREGILLTATLKSPATVSSGCKKSSRPPVPSLLLLRPSTSMGCAPSAPIEPDGPIAIDIPSMFKAVDTDGDGFLTKEELTTYMRDRANRAQEEIDALFKLMDKDSDGACRHKACTCPPAPRWTSWAWPRCSARSAGRRER